MMSSEPSAVSVCLVAPMPPPYGGIARWTSLVTRQARQVPQVQLRLVDTAVRGRAVHDTGTWARVRVGLPQMASTMRRVLAVLRGGRPDILHLTCSGQLSLVRDAALLALARLFGVPGVCHLRFGRVPEVLSGGGLERRALTWVLRLAHAVIAIDPATEEAISRFAPAVRLHQIPNCVDLSSVADLDLAGPRTQTVLFVGWVVPTKGLTELVTAWSRLAVEEWELVVAGPADQAYLDELAALVPSTHTVRLLGVTAHEEVMLLMATAGVFVLPSHTEGFPNVVVEAMASGCPVVATDVGAVSSMLADGCGVVVPVRDVDRLAGALQHLIGDPQERQRIADAARQRVLSRYELSAVFDQYVKLWQELAH